MTISALGLQLAVALVLAAPAPPPAAVRVLPRPEIPWVVAAMAPRAPAEALVERRALLDAGGRVSTVPCGGVLCVLVEGPPEAERLVLAAARALAPSAPIFLEGRVATVPSGALPAPRAAPRLGVRAPLAEQAATWSLPLPFSPWLLEDDGEVLRLAVERAVESVVERTRARRGDLQVALLLDAQGARLTLTARDRGELSGEQVRGALAELANTPLAPRAIQELRAQAAVARAQAGAAIGAGALAAARRAHWFGDAAAAPADDLGVRLRAAIVVETLRAAPPAPPAP